MKRRRVTDRHDRSGLKLIYSFSSSSKKILFCHCKYNMIIKADVSLVTLRIYPLERQINLLFIFNLIHFDHCLFRSLRVSLLRFFSTRVKSDKFLGYCKSVVDDQTSSLSLCPFIFKFNELWITTHEPSLFKRKSKACWALIERAASRKEPDTFVLVYIA